MKRIVLDTNVTIAAFFWNGNPRKIFELAKKQKVKLFYSQPILEEFIRVLAYPKFGLTNNEMLPIVNDFIKTGNKISVTSKLNVIKEDPTDNIFLECATDAKAQYIISGDHHLLDLKNYNKIQILNPKEFLETIKN